MVKKIISLIVATSGALLSAAAASAATHGGSRTPVDPAHVTPRLARTQPRRFSNEGTALQVSRISPEKLEMEKRIRRSSVGNNMLPLYVYYRNAAGEKKSFSLYLTFTYSTRKELNAAIGNVSTAILEAYRLDGDLEINGVFLSEEERADSPTEEIESPHLADAVPSMVASLDRHETFKAQRLIMILQKPLAREVRVVETRKILVQIINNSGAAIAVDPEEDKGK